MSQRITCRFRVRHYELDVLGHVNNAVYVQYMQEAAIEGSTRAGFGPDWYRARGTGWVIRRLTVRYERHLASVVAFLHLACALICLRFLRRAEAA